MGELGRLLGILAAIFALIGLLWLVAWRLGLLKPKPDEGSAEEQAEDGHPYRLCNRLLSPAEASFYGALRLAMPLLRDLVGANQEALIFAKVRLLDVLEPDPARLADRPGARKSAENRVISKHADFVLCHPETTKPLAVIELDDASHQSAKAQKRDALKDAACIAAGLPLIRIPAATRYQPEALAKQLHQRLQAGKR